MPVPPRQVELAEAMLWAEGSAVAGLSPVSRIQLFPGDLCYPSGAAADSGIAHRHQAAAVWVLKQSDITSSKYEALLAFGWGEVAVLFVGLVFFVFHQKQYSADTVFFVWVVFKKAVNRNLGTTSF